jgi:hypothetical protein
MADNQRNQGTGGQQGGGTGQGDRQDRPGGDQTRDQGDRDRTMGREHEQGKGSSQGQGGQGQGSQRQGGQRQDR